MRPAIVFLTLGVLWMTAVIAYGFVAGDILGETKILLKYPWFQISMVDLYTGLSLFSGWVIFRERSWWTSAIWIILFVLLGNLATCAYALKAVMESKGDWQTFWLGSKSHRAIPRAAGNSE
jgi:hypothetical protein